MSDTRVIILVVPSTFNTAPLFKSINASAAEQGHIAKPQIGPHHDAVFFRPIPVRRELIRSAEDCQ